MSEMNLSHVELGSSLLVESPRMSSGSVHLSTPVPLDKGPGIARRNYNEIFPHSPTPLRKGSGCKFTSSLGIAEYHKRQPRFSYSREASEIVSMTLERVPEFQSSPLIWMDTLSPESGSNSVVQAFACKNEKGDQDFLAVKQVLFHDDDDRRNAFEEVKLLEKARHKHIIACLGSYVYESKLCIMQYPVAKYDLARFLLARSDFLGFQKGNETKEMEHIARIKHYFTCLCNALEYLHRAGIKHRDIKPENILIDRFNTILLTDFDISKEYHNTTVGKSDGRTPCTIKYSPKEVCNGEPRDISSDVFSLGCVFLEMATVSLGRPIKDLYKDIGSFEGENAFSLRYWISVNEGKVERWISNLQSICHAWEGRHHANTGKQAQSTRALGFDHLDRIKEMMSDDKTCRPSLSDVQWTFRDLQDECEGCYVSCFIT